jgi:O-antigen/teichoic acid export membrane protein
MDTDQLRRSAALSVAQVIVAGGALLLFYHYLVATIGVTAVGLWSVVLATTAVGRIADFGLGGGVSRFVARAGAQHNPLRAATYVETAAVSTAVVSGLLAAIAFPLLQSLLPILVGRENVGIAAALLPYALLSFWITTITSIFQGGLDGALRVDLRNLILIASPVLQLGLGMLFVHWNGVMGLAYAQLIQAVMILALSLTALAQVLPALSLLPRKWDYSILREMVGFGWTLQVTSIAVLLFEPVTKGLLARFGGLASAGYYEMATRMIQQLRALLINANQVLVPAIADARERDPRRAGVLYRESYKVVCFLALLMSGAVMMSLPAICRLWIGHYDNRFVAFATLLTIGWFFNALTGPAYFAAIGAGRMHWNLLGHITMAAINVPAGYLFGLWWGGTGVVVGAMLSLVAGSVVILVKNHRQEGEPLNGLVPPGTALLLSASLIGIAVGFLSYYLGQRADHIVLRSVVSLAVWGGIIAWPAWRHPVRARLAASWTALFPRRGPAAPELSLRRRLVAWLLGQR